MVSVEFEFRRDLLDRDIQKKFYYFFIYYDYCWETYVAHHTFSFRKHPDFAKHVAEGMDVTQNAKHTRYLGK